MATAKARTIPVEDLLKEQLRRSEGDFTPAVRVAVRLWADGVPGELVPEQATAAMRALVGLSGDTGWRGWRERFADRLFRSAFQILLRRDVEWPAGSAAALVDAAAGQSRPSSADHLLPIDAVLRWLEDGAGRRLAPKLADPLRRLKVSILPRVLTPAEQAEYDGAMAALRTNADPGTPGWEPVEAALEVLRRYQDASPARKDEIDWARRIDELLAARPEAAVKPPYLAGDATAAAIAAAWAGWTPDVQVRWAALIEHCRDLKSVKPTARWSKRAAALLADLGPADTVAATLAGWLAKVGQPGYEGRRAHVPDVTIPDPTTVDLIRGLAVCLPIARDDDATAAALGDLAEAAFKKVPMVGPRCPVVGRACVAALSAMRAPAAPGQVARLQQKAKHASTRTAVERSLATVTKRTGLSAIDLQELSIPTHGFAADGPPTVPLGTLTATLATDGTTARVTFRKSDGAEAKSAPKGLAAEQADSLKRLKAQAKSATETLAWLRGHFDALMIGGRSWPAAEWRKRFLDHPLARRVVSRLIWRATAGPHLAFVPSPDVLAALIDINGRAARVPDDVSVSLWHPAAVPQDEVLAWRRRLADLGVVQPFKQAHREVYLLTDAERSTGTYSNRFAAHVLRQHQFKALCDARGWAYQFQGAWDSHNVPTRRIPQFGLTAEFWVDPPDGDADANTSGAGVYLHLLTDQVRFHSDRGGGPLPLDQVPPLVLSEVLRDVDLFVGVASVGNDPTWQDGGPEGRYRTYWQNYSFGELSATAQTRRAVLETLLPRLTKLKGKWELTDRFLVVRGSLRAYKIHLGSGNILMEPNDQYLCIVPARGSAAGDDSAGRGGVFLPFEGDGTMAVILSKAFMLADDAKIKDASITSQIKRG